MFIPEVMTSIGLLVCSLAYIATIHFIPVYFGLGQGTRIVEKMFNKSYLHVAKFN